MKISLPANDLSERRLSLYAGLGIEAVTVPHRMQTEYRDSPPKPLVPGAASGKRSGQPAVPDGDELERVCARVRAFGLEPGSTSAGVSHNILLGTDDRAADLAQFAETVRVIGGAGIGVVTLNFMPLRASAGYGSHNGGRGGALVRDFDAARVAGWPPEPEIGTHSNEQMWERLIWFMERAVPVAREAGVRFAMHPNDPPVDEFCGVAQPLRDGASMRRLVQEVDDPANSIFYDSGVATEWGEDAAEVAAWFAERDRIGLAHIRNVRVDEVRQRYTEVFVDEGDADIGAVLSALHAGGYSGGIDPDHTPGYTMDVDELWIGWAAALGSLRGHLDCLTNNRPVSS